MKIPKIKEVVKHRKADHCVYISNIKKVCETFNWIPRVSPYEAFNKIADWVNRDEEILKKLYL